MKFEVSSSELLKHLNIAAGAIGSNPVIPVMEDFLFDIVNNKLTITTTNLETTIITTMEVLSEQDGRIAIPAKMLLETLKALPEQPITFTIDDETNGITILSSFGKYKLAGDSPEDFPTPPSDEDTESLTLKAKKVLKGITNTIFATSNDDIRLAMTGVLFQIDFNKINIVATDAHKLVKYTVANLKTDIAASLIIPKKGLMLVKNSLTEDEDVHIGFNKTNVFFTMGKTRIACRLIDAKYPDYNAVIPVDNPNEVLINRKDFLNSLKRTAIYANKSTYQIVLNLAEGSMTVSAQDLDFSNEATEQLSCEFNAEPMTIGFNGKFLLEILSVLESDEVKLLLSTPTRAGLIVPAQEDADEVLVMLLMPVMTTQTY
ncbi:MAG: DNA polymerase III subunit beta [Saprospiraceae bacterium]|nr:DNA polymerase III subunit beta [Saprospiraceae bacterium]MBK6564717.1 DNA polymerase III subunit beta [Saprospiraceae bacterium]MBK6784756.1 DNA polymerase III subunit beta [Saprospiraceae bacterium]MBK7523359.1 DNA polymerase III subunit beta [Saprospiraceae bacterium]MBK8371650.1 DNA polymerase III subunit beta [Saprospiraceae bacterium]